MPVARFRGILAPLLVAGIISGVYAIAAWSNQFVYDDHEVIENQYPIRHLNDLGRIFAEPHYLNFPYYRPVTRATFALQMSVWGRNPLAYHLFNSILAGAVVLAAYGLLRRPGIGLSPPAALMAAGWFGLHPAFSECVYPAASGRETLLSALMIVLTTWAYLGRGLRWYLGAMILFAIALLSKEQAAVLPGIFVLADVLGIAQKPAKLREWILKYLPVAVIFCLYFFVRHLIFRQPTLQVTLFEHPLDPLKSLLYGLQTAFAPFMALRYEPPFDAWFDIWLSIVACAAAVVVATACAWGNKRVRRIGLFWLGWFVLLQLPTAHILRQEAGYSERYAALAILSIPATVAMLLDRAMSSRMRMAAVAAVVAWMGILLCISYLRGSYYANDASFCLQWQNTNPAAAGPHDGLGRLAQERHEWAAAMQEYQIALSLEPDDATARNNLANLLAEAGDFAGAAQQYEWLMSHRASGADFVATITNYAQVLGEEAVDRNDPAMRDRAHGLLLEAIALRPDYAQAHFILGLWDSAFGSREAAIRQLKIALELRPDWPEVEAMLAKMTSQPAATNPSETSNHR